MSVRILVEFKVDDLEDATQVMEMNAGILDDLTRDARAHGAIHHEFFTTDDGDLAALDEWDSVASFTAFFDGNTRIQDLLKQAGITEPPTITVLKPMEVAGTF